MADFTKDTVSDIFDVEAPEGYEAPETLKDEESFSLSDDQLDALIDGMVTVVPKFEEKPPVISDGEGGVDLLLADGDAPDARWVPGVVPIPTVPEEPKEPRVEPHFLLKTKKTVARSRNYSYGEKEYEYDFSYDWRWNRAEFTELPGDNKAPEFRRFARLFYDCIIPNAIIARDGGLKVTSEDGCAAIFQGMRTGASDATVKRWEDYVRSMGSNDWVKRYVEDVFDLYVNGKTREGKQGKGYSLKSYVTKHMSKHCKSHVNSLKHFERKNSPKLQELIDLWKERPEIGKWTCRKLKEEFGFSNDTVARFKKATRYT